METFLALTQENEGSMPSPLVQDLEKRLKKLEEDFEDSIAEINYLQRQINRLNGHTRYPYVFD